MTTVWIDGALLFAGAGGTRTELFARGALRAVLQFEKQNVFGPGLIASPGRRHEESILRKILRSEFLEFPVIGPQEAIGSKDIALRLRRGRVHMAWDKRRLYFADLSGSIEFLLRGERRAKVSRITNETRIEVQLDLNGTGQASISTGIGFFDHMLEQLARHSRCDLRLRVRGDLDVDEHHTIEDVALALGEAYDKALGDRRGIARYGFVLPMDDASASVSMDLSGRPYLSWRAVFKRERIGGMPTEMFRHFFKSFSDAARMTLHVSARGENEHHKIEAIFKGFARTLRRAMSSDGACMEIPSTKGVL